MSFQHIQDDLIDAHLWSSPQPQGVICLSHSAGGDIDNDLLQAIAKSLVHSHTIILFRMKYRQQGRKIPPRPQASIEDFSRIVAYAKKIHPKVFIGGRSYGCRVATHYAAENQDLSGVICLGFPLFPNKNNRTPERLDHFSNITAPVLILQGDRDHFGDATIHKKLLLNQPDLTVFGIPYADHSFTTRKSDPFNTDQVTQIVIEHLKQWPPLHPC